MKRNLVIVLFLFLIAAGGYFYFSGEELAFSRDTSVYKAVPVSAPFFFELSSAKAIPFDNPVIREMNEAGIATEWFNWLQKADSVIAGSDDIPKSLRNSSLILSYGFTGRNEMVPLITTKTESNNRQNAVKKLMHTLYPPGKYAYREKDYGKHIITEIDRGGAEEPLFFSFVEGLFLASSRSILVEQVIRQLSSEGILRNPYFLEVNKAAGLNGVSFYINHNWLNGFLGNILNRKTVERVDEFGATRRYQPAVVAEKFKSYADWSELEFRFGNDQLLLNGISAAADSLHHFLSVFSDQQPVRFRAEEVLPHNTSFFCTFTFSAKGAFFKGLEDFFTHSPVYYHREERMKRFDKGFRTNMRNTFQQWVKDEIIVASTTIPVNPENKTVFFILQTEGRPATEEQLQNLLAGYAARAETDPEEWSSDFQIDNEVHFPVYRFPYPSFPGVWLGSPFAIAEASYVSFYDDLMVFSNSEKGLHEYLRNMTLGATLTKDARYQKFRQLSSSRANMNVFVDVNKAYGLRNELFSDVLLKHLENKEENIRKFGMVNWQVQRDKDVYFNSVAIAYQPNAGEEAETAWQSIIGNNIAIKPQLVVNHDDVANREIIIQDEMNILHQLTGAGRVRWSVPLQEPVLGEIHQVDYYKNRKLQYLFNTREKLYLIDRNGNNVDGFPVTLHSPATNGVNVFDYDNNRNYRYFVAGEDNKVYAYDYAGKIISGWNSGKTETPVTTPVQHFRIGNKDYIVFKDKSQIYIKDRQGETRVETSAWFANSKNPLALNLDGTPKIVATDTGGTVFYIYFDGTLEEKKTADFSENHFFVVDDLDGNKIPDFVFVDGNELTVMNENGKKLFSKKLDNPLRYPPNIYTFAADLKKVGVTDATANRIYLFEPNGKLHQGFPLQGNSEFSIGKLSDNAPGLNLIVGSEGGKLYNYTIN